MSEKKFNFVSPGIFLEEIDNSQLPSAGPDIGPVVIGRTERGPGMRPITVNSFSEYVELFGNPVPGGRGGDSFREGNYSSPMYATYAAQAWLRNNSPLTTVRLMGYHHPNRTSGDGEWNAGWDLGNITNMQGVGARATPTDAGAGAYGLFLFNSSSTGTQKLNLGAVFYSKTSLGHVVLTGTMEQASQYDNYAGNAASTPTTASQCTPIETSSANRGAEFTAMIGSHDTVYAGTAEKIVFNFDENSDNYIRNVFNTNATLTNAAIDRDDNKTYFLGESYTRSLLAQETYGQDGSPRTGLSSLNDITHGVIVALKTQGGTEWADRQRQASAGRTGWFIGQDIGDAANYKPADKQKLFRLIAREDGTWTQNNIKVSIDNIRPATNKSTRFGTFTVVLRKIDDLDKAPKVIERFTGCDLNPNSANYVARKIGDKYVEWDETQRRYRNYGNFTNMSKYVYVDVNKTVEGGGADDRLLPFGFFGPPKPKDVTGLKIDGDMAADNSVWISPEENNIPPRGGALFGNDHSTAILTTPNLTASFLFPKLPLKLHGQQGNLPKPTMQYWGIDLAKSGSSKFDTSLTELLRPVATVGPDVSDDAAALEYMYIFSLDNLVESGSVGASYMSGSRSTHLVSESNGGNSSDGRPRGSITSHSGSSVLLTGSSHGYNRFTTVFHGGFDGLDITEKDPFRNEFITANGSETNNYAFYSIKRAIDSIRDAEVIEMNLAAIPGITQPALTEHLISICEDRGDALAIIDLEKDYVPPHENEATEAANKPNVDLAVNTLKGRQINSSYGCAYFPWVQIRDTISNAILFVPPSVVALGTMGSSEAVREVWFAPAGFTRGGLTDGAAGVPVTGVKMHLSSDDRDKLYAANINPIASFPAEGIVIFGQKTLQVTPSALDRINVRRLLIFIKKQVSRIAATTLFEQNVVATWNGFKGQVETFLSNVKGGLGLTDFKVVLDETTTTPELVDRNIMYAKVFLKPAQAIEFIALDFIITDSGASFAD